MMCLSTGGSFMKMRTVSRTQLSAPRPKPAANPAERIAVGSEEIPCPAKKPRRKAGIRAKQGIAELEKVNTFEARTFNRSQTQPRIAVGKEEQRNEYALTFEKSRSKRYAACSDVVRLKGLEPTRIAAREPKSRMSTNSITGAYLVLGGIGR